MESPERKNLIEKARLLFAKDDHYTMRSGLDFLFTSDSEKQKVPVRWKQYLVTWSAIYPLSIIVPWIVLPLLRMVNVPESKVSYLILCLRNRCLHHGCPIIHG